ncbi:MAG: TetR/AcrR family transcriptional regulator [Thermoflexales bacterium]|nr:TetR/AcrR family transcriptional regulator [Thermoflexales bacterium]
MSVTSHRREREKAQRRKDILQAAREVFLNGRLFQGTIDDVAARAEVSKGTVYLYFESKETILALLLLEGLESLLERFKIAYEPCAALPAGQCLERLASAYLRFCRECPAHFRLMVAFDRGQFRERVSAALYGQVFDSSKRLLQFVADVIQHGIDSREFQPLDAWHTTGMLWAALNGVLLLADHPLRRELVQVPVEALFEQTVAVLLSGIRET